MRLLSGAVREHLRSALEARPVGVDAMAFVEAVVIQRAWPLGEAPAGAHPDTERGADPGTEPAADPGTEPAASIEARVAEQVVRIIDGSAGDDATVARVADELAEDLALLAAFFQNLDLLPADRGPHFDAIALVTAAAVQRLADTLSRG